MFWPASPTEREEHSFFQDKSGFWWPARAKTTKSSQNHSAGVDSSDLHKASKSKVCLEPLHRIRAKEMADLGCLRNTSNHAVSGPVHHYIGNNASSLEEDIARYEQELDAIFKACVKCWQSRLQDY